MDIKVKLVRERKCVCVNVCLWECHWERSCDGGWAREKHEKRIKGSLNIRIEKYEGKFFQDKY